MKLRQGFSAIVAGWTRIDNWNALNERIERVTAWVGENGTLEPGEESIMERMIETRIAMEAVTEEALKVTPREQILDGLPKPQTAPKGASMIPSREGACWQSKSHLGRR